MATEERLLVDAISTDSRSDNLQKIHDSHEHDTQTPTGMIVHVYA